MHTQENFMKAANLFPSLFLAVTLVGVALVPDLAHAGNNPPAEPGAFSCEPLKAAVRGR